MSEEIGAEIIKKDFGSQTDADTPEQEIYRREFYKYLQLSVDAQIITASLDDISDTIDSIVSA